MNKYCFPFQGTAQNIGLLNFGNWSKYDNFQYLLILLCKHGMFFFGLNINILGWGVGEYGQALRPLLTFKTQFSNYVHMSAFLKKDSLFSI